MQYDIGSASHQARAEKTNPAKAGFTIIYL